MGPLLFGTVTILPRTTHIYIQHMRVRAAVLARGTYDIPCEAASRYKINELNLVGGRKRKSRAKATYRVIARERITREAVAWSELRSENSPGQI